jgi:hypothetical protein
MALKRWMIHIAKNLRITHDVLFAELMKLYFSGSCSEQVQDVFMHNPKLISTNKQVQSILDRLYTVDKNT